MISVYLSIIIQGPSKITEWPLPVEGQVRSGQKKKALYFEKNFANENPMGFSFFMCAHIKINLNNNFKKNPGLQFLHSFYAHGLSVLVLVLKPLTVAITNWSTPESSR